MVHLSLYRGLDMKIEFWKSRGEVKFTRGETITVTNGSGKAVERITCVKVMERGKDEQGEYTPYKMEISFVG